MSRVPWRNPPVAVFRDVVGNRKVTPFSFSTKLGTHPGEVTEEYDVRWRVEHMKNVETAFIGVGLHFVQEDQPVATGRAIADWYRRHFAKDSNKWFTNAQP